MSRKADAIIRSKVNELFVTGIYNCSMTSYTVLSEIFHVPVSNQAIDAAQVMPGAGGVGDLCGFISGGLMFIGVWGGFTNIPRQALYQISKVYSQSILDHFGSLHCRDLRSDCAVLAVDMLIYSVTILEEAIKSVKLGIET